MSLETPTPTTSPSPPSRDRGQLRRQHGQQLPNSVPASIGLVVSGDGKGNGGDDIGSGGVGTASCSAMRASIDADIGGSSLIVFRVLRRRV
nr:hypothetical protein [Tanacetum cinerariifolium]